MSLKRILTISLLGCVAALQPAVAEEDSALTREELAERLRASEDVTGRLLTIEVEYAGTQVDQDGQAHELYVSRDENTVFLCLFETSDEEQDPASLETITGRILRIELQKQDLRDHRIYAIWIE